MPMITCFRCRRGFRVATQVGTMEINCPGTACAARLKVIRCSACTKTFAVDASLQPRQCPKCFTALPSGQPLAEVTAMGDFWPLFRACRPYTAWIVGHIHKIYGRDLSDIRTLIVPHNAGALGDFAATKAGGGIYLRFNEGMKAKVYHEGLVNYEESTETTIPYKERLVAGKCMVLAKSVAADSDNRLKLCWVIWHEYGHALGESSRKGYGLSEPEAWKFELEAVYSALEEGVLEGFGFSREAIGQFLATRKSVYSTVKSDAATEAQKRCTALEKRLAA